MRTIYSSRGTYCSVRKLIDVTAAHAQQEMEFVFFFLVFYTHRTHVLYICMNSDQNKNPLWVDGTANERVSERNANDYVWFEMERVHRTSSGPQRSV